MPYSAVDVERDNGEKLSELLVLQHTLVLGFRVLKFPTREARQSPRSKHACPDLWHYVMGGATRAHTPYSAVDVERNNGEKLSELLVLQHTLVLGFRVLKFPTREARRSPRSTYARPDLWHYIMGGATRVESCPTSINVCNSSCCTCVCVW